ncbi:MAG: nucleotide exchange factor GrpE [Nocardia sp.]|nr:nucleotide exchange factor GrpE [Nocardia sp.]
MTDKNSSEDPVTFVDIRDLDGEASTEPKSGSEAAAQSAAAPAAEAAADAPGGEAPVAETPAAEAASESGTELAERTADLQRLTAEYANYRRRVERDRKAAIDSAKAAVVTELLGVLDDLDRARAHGDLESGPLKSVADKLATALRKQGLEEFGTEGEPFDPTLHEAVQHEGEGHDPVIGVVMRKGYRFGDRVLRHALVGVSDGVGDLAGSDAGEIGAGKSDTEKSGAENADGAQ